MSTLNIHHLGLAVSDLSNTAKFFTQILGFQIVNQLTDYPATFISNGHTFLTLWQTEADALEFNRRTRVGLHHFALSVATESDLNSLYREALNFPGVQSDFPPEALADSLAKHAMLFEPSGIRLELVWAGD